MKSKSAARKARRRVMFLFDVDNTLLNNDRVIEDLRAHLTAEVGAKKCLQYWKIFERLRAECGFADYLGALQRYRQEYPHEMHLLAVSRFLIEYPFANRLFPGSLDAIEHVQRWGPAALLTDGDVVFQPWKVQRSGLHEAIQGRVLIYIHKEVELADVAAHFPADHYVMVDDKLRLLTAIKKIWKGRVTTVFVRQGHYAHDAKILASCPPADLDIRVIGDLSNYDLGTLIGAGTKAAS